MSDTGEYKNMCVFCLIEFFLVLFFILLVLLALQYMLLYLCLALYTHCAGLATDYDTQYEVIVFLEKEWLFIIFMLQNLLFLLQKIKLIYL